MPCSGSIWMDCVISELCYKLIKGQSYKGIVRKLSFHGKYIWAPHHDITIIIIVTWPGILVGWLSRLSWRWGGDQSTTLNVIYQNVYHTLKFMNLPGYSAHYWCGLENPRWRPRWPPEINARVSCVRIGVLIWFISFHQINDIYLCSACLNFLMIHLNMV